MVVARKEMQEPEQNQTRGGRAPSVGKGATVDKSPGAALGDKERLAVEMRVTGRSNAEIATALKVNRTTVWRWSQNQGFTDYHNHLGAERVRGNLQLLRETTARSLKVYMEKITEGDEVMAKDWMHLVRKATELDNLVFFGS